jgi:hypothetical protein
LVRPLVLTVATLLLAACTSVGGLPASPPPPLAAPRVTPPAAIVSGCPVSTPITDEKPTNANTASFSRAWFVSPDRLLWASAPSRFYEGSNKVLWERPGSIVSVSGKLLGGDAKAAGVPTITGPQGYESLDYQASGVTFPASGCWEVEARAGSSVLSFVTLVYPAGYSGAGRRCEDLADIYAQSDAVVLATSAAERPDESFPGFTWYMLSVSRTWKGPLSIGGTFDLLSDTSAEPRITPTTRFVLFLAHDQSRPWRIICPLRSVAMDTADRRLIRPSDQQAYMPIITDTDFASLDSRLQGLAK